MASDLDVTTATWGTENLIGTTGEVLPSTVQAQMANNEGFNYWTTRHLCQQGTALVAVRAAYQTDNQKTYLASGTYAMYAAMAVEMTGNYASSYARISVDGTVIAEQTGAPFSTAWVYGSQTVIVGTESWVDVEYKALGFAAGTETTLTQGIVFFRRGTQI